MLSSVTVSISVLSQYYVTVSYGKLNVTYHNVKFQIRQKIQVKYKNTKIAKKSHKETIFTFTHFHHN